MKMNYWKKLDLIYLKKKCITNLDKKYELIDYNNIIPSNTSYLWEDNIKFESKSVTSESSKIIVGSNNPESNAGGYRKKKNSKREKKNKQSKKLYYKFGGSKKKYNIKYSNKLKLIKRSKFRKKIYLV